MQMCKIIPITEVMQRLSPMLSMFCCSSAVFHLSSGLMLETELIDIYSPLPKLYVI